MCCKSGSNCAAKRWNGIQCTDDRKSLYLDGTYFLTLAPISLPLATTSLGVALWYKHLQQPLDTLRQHSYPAVLAQVGTHMQIVLDYSYEDTSKPDYLTKLTSKDMTGTLQVLFLS